MGNEDDYSDVGPDANLLPDVQAIAVDLRTVFVRDPQPETAAQHVAAMVSVSLAPVVPLRRRRKRAAVVGAVALVGVMASGGLAAAGVLPAPLQSGVAHLVRPIGIDLPDSGSHAGQEGSGDPAPDRGQTDRAPGQQDDPSPSTSTEAPGQSGDTPSPSTPAPGQSGDTPSPSTPAPDQSGDTPSPSTPAPGQSGASSSRSDTAPGQTGAGGNNKPTVPPGQVDNPGNGKSTSGGPPTSVPDKGNR
jgi:hypothetical protein